LYDNILCRDGQFALIDFGKAKFVNVENKRDLMIKDVYNLCVYFNNDKGVGKTVWNKKVNDYFKNFPVV
jgi:serine/threonine-protein kinase RIO1